MFVNKEGGSINFKKEPLLARLKNVESIVETINQGRIRIQEGPHSEKGHGAPRVVWGVIVFDGLPVVFQAWPENIPNQEIIYLQDGITAEAHSNWWPHAPYFPLEFTPPRFTHEIDDIDRKFILGNLGVADKTITQAEQKGKLNNLYVSSLNSKAGEYKRLKEDFAGNPYKKALYDAAIRVVCEEAAPLNKKLRKA